LDILWRSTVYDVVTKYTPLEQFNKGSSMPARKSHSKERIARIPAVVERTQTLISDDPGQSLRKLVSIVGVSEPTMHRIAKENLRYKSYTLKIRQMLSEAARTSRVTRLAPILASQQPRFKLVYYVWSVVERITNKSRHPNVTSLRIAIEAAFVDMDSATLQRANASDRK